MYAPRIPIFPRKVSGHFRRLKWWVMAGTLGIYYLTPWLRWDRGAGRPDQAVLVDLAHRRFYFFGFEIWSHEFYFVAGLLIMAGLGLFLFTSALGRVWCGYACPQTVWTDLFTLVERWIEGDRNARVRLWKAPWDARKWRLRLTKWAIWLLIAVATGGAWVFYFTDAPTLAGDLATGSAPPVAWITIAILSATTFVFGGFMREQVCIYMCPWPRIQGAMMDERTLTVGYREWRGEPRLRGRTRRAGADDAARRIVAEQARAGRGTAIYGPTPYGSVPRTVAAPAKRVTDSVDGKGAEESPGDCIDCRACVNVCPMGIDIRDGQQLECITCALCIDACDDVMARIGKPRGLIDYLALADEPAERQGAKPVSLWRHVLRWRTVAYSALWAAFGLALLAALLLRPGIEATVAPIRNPTFVVLADGAVRNTYDIRLRNKGAETRRMNIAVAPDAFHVAIEGVDAASGAGVDIPADSQRLVRTYVTAPAGSALADDPRTAIRIIVADPADGSTVQVGTHFNGREN